jgi:hypothetical protein
MECRPVDSFIVRNRREPFDLTVNDLIPKLTANMAGIDNTWMASETTMMMIRDIDIHIQHKKSRKHKTIPPETAQYGGPDIIRVNGRGRRFYIYKRRRLGYLNW